MTEGIKEILDNLYRYKDEDYMKYQPEDILTIEDVWLLLDYITNLQQENKAKTHQIEVLEEIVNYERNIRNDKLQQENKELNRMCELYSKSLYNAELTDYKSRCEKAIEYMETYNELVVPEADIKSLILKEEYKKIINILYGSDGNE